MQNNKGLKDFLLQNVMLGFYLEKEPEPVNRWRKNPKDKRPGVGRLPPYLKYLEIVLPLLQSINFYG